MAISSAHSPLSRSSPSKMPSTVPKRTEWCDVRLPTHSQSPSPARHACQTDDIVLLSLVRPDGAVAGDSFGETDTRFSYILVQALTLLGKLYELDKLHEGRGRELVVDNIRRSMNFDGGFGTEPGAESHGGQGALSFTGVDAPCRMGMWTGAAKQMEQMELMELTDSMGVCGGFGITE